MKNRVIKKAISGLIALVLLITAIPIKASEKEVELNHNMEQFFETGYGESLVKRDGFYHMDFVEKLREDKYYDTWLLILDMTYNTLQTGWGEPSEDKYREVLINIMKTYELDNASVISEQNKLDNNKTAGSYVYDAVQIAASCAGMSKITKNVEPEIKLIVNKMFTTIDNTTRCIEEVSNLKTLLQNYTNHDAFLTIIEHNSEGKLRDAATSLKENMQNSMKTIIETYKSVTNWNVFESSVKGALDDSVWEILQKSPLYKSNSKFIDFVEMGKLGATVGGSSLAGVELGQFGGNLTVQGEDGLNCFLELKAIYDISYILEQVMIYYENNYKDLSQESVEKTIEEYVTYGNYLISCRIRGEYRFCSMFAERGIASIFYGNTAELAKEVFEQMVDKLSNLKNCLDNLLKNSIIEVSDYFHKKDELVRLLAMAPYDDHSLGFNSQAFIVDGFSIEWYDIDASNDIFSMDNHGCDYIKLFDIMLGDELKESEKKLYDKGWVKYLAHEGYDNEDWHAYVNIENGNRYYLCLDIDENKKVVGWFINDWPEGSHISDFFEALESEGDAFIKRWNVELECFMLYSAYKKQVGAEWNEEDIMYTVSDINDDEQTELLVKAEESGGFVYTWIFVNQGGNIELVYEHYGYGPFRYSKNYNAVLVSPEFKPFSGNSSSPFYQLNGDKFEYIFQVGKDMGECYYADSNTKRTITNDELSKYLSDTVYFEWKYIGQVEASANYYWTEDSFEDSQKGDVVDKSTAITSKEICEIVSEHYNNEYNTNKYVAFESECSETQNGYSLMVRRQDGNEANILAFCVNVNLSTGEVTNDLGDKWFLD